MKGVNEPHGLLTPWQICILSSWVDTDKIALSIAQPRRPLSLLDSLAPLTLVSRCRWLERKEISWSVFLRGRSLTDAGPRGQSLSSPVFTLISLLELQTALIAACRWKSVKLSPFFWCQLATTLARDLWAGWGLTWFSSPNYYGSHITICIERGETYISILWVWNGLWFTWTSPWSICLFWMIVFSWSCENPTGTWKEPIRS